MFNVTETVWTWNNSAAYRIFSVKPIPWKSIVALYEKRNLDTNRTGMLVFDVAARAQRSIGYRFASGNSQIAFWFRIWSAKFMEPVKRKYAIISVCHETKRFAHKLQTPTFNPHPCSSQAICIQHLRWRYLSNGIGFHLRRRSHYPLPITNKTEK